MIVVHHLNNSHSQRIFPYDVKFYQPGPMNKEAPADLKGVHPIPPATITCSGRIIPRALRSCQSF
jgi:hypothetical protein